MMIFKIIMGQSSDCCEGNTEVINAEKGLQEQFAIKKTCHNPVVVSAVPVQEETKVNAEPPKVKTGLKSQSKMLGEGMKIAEPINNRLKELGKLNLSGSTNETFYAP